MHSVLVSIYGDLVLIPVSSIYFVLIPIIHGSVDSYLFMHVHFWTPRLFSSLASESRVCIFRANCIQILFNLDNEVKHNETVTIIIFQTKHSTCRHCC